MSDSIIGIDLGTTFCAVATIDEMGKAIVLKNVDGKYLTPSVIAFLPDRIAFGDEAKGFQSLGDSNIASFFKSRMGDKSFYLEFHGKRYDATALSGLLLGKLKRDAETALGKQVSQAVITVPAYFNNFQREATVMAGKHAGLDVLRIINEPTAAAIAYGVDKNRGDQTLLVYDLGGGTFDVTLMRSTAGSIQVIATDGDHQLGGKDWDGRIMQHVVDQFKEEYGTDPLTDIETLNDLLVQCENAKKSLSQATNARIKIVFDGNKGNYTISREQFVEITSDLLERTKTLCNAVLAESKTSWTDIDGVLLVGGSTRMPQVLDAVEIMSGKSAIHGINIDEAVAVGAAIQAEIDLEANTPAQLSSRSTSKMLAGRKTVQDVTSHSLGMIAESADRSKYVNAVILPRNSEIPGEETRPLAFRTSSKKGNEMDVYLLQGEGDHPGDCVILGKYVFSNITHEKDGKAVLDITYNYDKNGIVAVSGVQQSTGKSLTTRIEPVPEDMSWVEESPRIHGKKDAKMIVTSPCFDNIGKVLNILGLPYDAYTPKTGFECDMLFLNCGTHDPINKDALHDFVAKGGILYASDLTSSLISSTFPGIFHFCGGGPPGRVEAIVRDKELQDIVGGSITVYFDMGAWSILNSISRGKVILESIENRKPLMVQVPFQKGEIFYTCFHNHAQANDKEMGLLELLIMKQLGEFKQSSIAQVCEDLKTSISEYKRLFAK